MVAGLSRSAPTVWAPPLATVSCIVTGEEVSWGQRIFGLQTPGALAAVDVQGELNLHSIEGVHGSVRAVSVLALLALLVAFPPAMAPWVMIHQLADRVRLPVPPLLAVPLLRVGIGFMAGPRLLAGTELLVLDGVGEPYVTAGWFACASNVWAPAEGPLEGKRQHPQ